MYGQTRIRLGEWETTFHWYIEIQTDPLIMASRPSDCLKNTEKSPEDLRRLAVIQTPVKNP